MAARKTIKKKANTRVRRKLSDAFKSRVVRYASNHSVKEAAEKYSVSPTLIPRWRSLGHGKPKAPKNRRVARREVVVAEDQEATLQDEVKRLQAENTGLRSVVIDLLLAAS